MNSKNTLTEENNVLIFYANPKTGTSTIEYNARINLDKTEWFLKNVGDNHLSLSKESKMKLKFISGHRINYKIVDDLSSIKNVNLITVFRDPAEQIISAYNYDIHMKYKFKIPFYIWYKFLIPKNPQSSHFVRRFKLNFIKSLFLNKNNFKEILNYLKQFNLVLTTNQINTIIPFYFNEIGIINDEKYQLKTRKVTGIAYPKYLKLNNSLREKLYKDNELDFKVFQYFNQQKQ